MADSSHINDDGLEARDKILATASRLFARQGYENTSLSQVARQANVSKALIFWHFESKETLYRTALRKTLEPYFFNVDALEGLDERAQLELLIDRFYAFTRENVSSVRFFLTLTVRAGEQGADEGLHRVIELYRAFEGSIAGIIERGCRTGRFRPETDARREAGLIMATLAGILVQRLMSAPDSAEPESLLAHLKATLFARLGCVPAADHTGQLD